jgi:hypothetical protein
MNRIVISWLVVFAVVLTTPVNPLLSSPYALIPYHLVVSAATFCCLYRTVYPRRTPTKASPSPNHARIREHSTL